MTATHHPGRRALEEFLPELDIRHESRHSRLDPREIRLEPVGFSPEPAEAPLAQVVAQVVAESSPGAQLWPMLAAAFVGIGVTVLAFVAFSRFAQ